MIGSSGASSRPRKGEAAEMRLIFMVSFAVFLVVAVVGRFLPSSWRWDAVGPHSGRSILGEARAATHTFVPFAFMG
jgi:hypothetical protein